VILPVAKPALSVCFLAQPVEFDAPLGEPVHTLFVLLSPTVRIHLQLLARILFTKQFCFDELITEFGIAGLSEAEKDQWNRVWHRLKPWPDSVAGLTRLKKKYLIAPLSNGNVLLLTEMAKNAGLPWDLILSAELSRHYKPDHETYLKAAELLSLKPGEVMMAAAHGYDLKAARDCGLRTGFIHRPDEHGVGGPADHAKPGDFDVVSSDMVDLAQKLGA